ncbi:MAG: hypothetical protein ACREAG_06940 [Nitrosopumilaceae archaeon]
MRWSGWPLTVIIVTASLAISALLFQLGIFFFFLPIIFIPFFRFFKLSSFSIPSCPVCGLRSNGNYCSRCGTKLT